MLRVVGGKEEEEKGRTLYCCDLKFSSGGCRKLELIYWVCFEDVFVSVGVESLLHLHRCGV